MRYFNQVATADAGRGRAAQDYNNAAGGFGRFLLQ